MAHGTSRPVLRYLAHALSPGGLSDAELLERFATQGDECAFTALVRRHGPAVLGVCLRVLRHRQDAEDAFQAAFLVLARRARAIRKRESLASWLHGVALRVARKARAGNLRRRVWPGAVPDRPAPEEPAFLWRDLRPVLDEEIAALPVPYRSAFVLCYLEGKTNAEAAELLGCPKGTVLSRLARARERLARGLSRRGVALSAGALAGLLAAEALRAAPPAALAAATVRAALAFAAGQAAAASVAHSLAMKGLHAMRMTWMAKALAVTAALGVAGAGAGLLAPRGAAPGVAEAHAEAPPEAGPRPDPEPPSREEERTPEARLERLLHEWARADGAVREARWRFKRTRKDKDAEHGDVTRGEVLFRRPGLLRVNVADEKGKPAVILFADDKALYNYDFRGRTERVFPPRPGGRRPAGPDRAPAPFTDWVPEPAAWGLVGPPVRQLAQRFDMRLAKEDRYYAYIELRPMAPEDRKLFWRARLVLDRDGPWLRQLWFELPDGGEDFWDYEKPDPRPEPPVTRESLTEGLPQGWKRIDARAPKPPPPDGPAPAAQRPPEPRLEAVLHRWAQASQAIQEARFGFTQTAKDKASERTEVRRGEVFYKRPNLLRVNVRDEEGRPTETFLCEDRALHVLNFRERTETIFALPPDLPEDGKQAALPNAVRGRLAHLFDFAFEPWSLVAPPTPRGGPRFDVRLAKEDQYYVYIDLAPRTPADRAELQRARVVLNRDGPWVQQLWVEHPNGVEVTWDFDKPDPNPDPPITRERLLKDLKNLPPGWKRHDVGKARRDGKPPPPAPPQ
jgi:TIGR03009 family protein